MRRILPTLPPWRTIQEQFLIEADSAFDHSSAATSTTASLDATRQVLLDSGQVGGFTATDGPSGGTMTSIVTST